MPALIRDGVRLGYDQVGFGDPPLVFVHGLACHRGFWSVQVSHFAPAHRVIAVDLRGHGASDAPAQRYTMGAFAEDLVWMFDRLGLDRPVVVGHSLGGLVTLELTATAPDRVGAAVLVDSVLLPGGDRADVVLRLVTGLRGADAEGTLRAYFESFFGPDDDPGRRAWIVDEAVRTPSSVTSSVWEEALRWDDAAALARCRVPLLYLDAGTPNADLDRCRQLCPDLLIGRTVGSGHFSPLEVPEQVNAMIDRFLVLRVPG